MAFAAPFGRVFQPPFATAAAAEVFDLYVDWKNGNDAWPGTLAQPLKTLAHCLSAHAVNGNKIGILGSGANDEVYYERGITTALTGITIKAVPGHSPVMSPAELKTAWVPTGGTVNVYNTAEDDAAVYSVWNGAQRLTSVANVALCDATPNSYFFDNPGNLLHVNIGGAAPTYIQCVNSTGFNFILRLNGAGDTVDGIDARWGGPLFWYITANTGTIKNSDMLYLWPNTTYTNGAVTIAAGTGSIIDACTLAASYRTYAVGVYVLTAATSVTIKNSDISTAKYGIALVVGTNHVITGCTIHDVGDGIDSIAGVGVTYTASYNTFYNCGHGATRIAGVGSFNICHHNLIYATAGTAELCNYGLITDGGNVFWYHNVVANLENGVAATAGFLAQTNDTVTAYNNIAYKSQIGFDSPAIYGATFVADYNCGNQNASGNFRNDWVQQANDITDDPLFTNPATYTYTLQAGSPCLDTGVFVAGYSELGPPTDMGRWET